MKVTHCGVTYDCATAVKCEVNKFIKLYDENALEIASFDNINDFSDYTISGGSFTTPGSCPLPIPLFVFNLGGKTYCALNVKDGERVELAQAADFLPLTGGTLSGSLYVDKGHGYLGSSKGYGTYLGNVPDIGDLPTACMLIVKNYTISETKDALVFEYRDKNGSNGYKIFGEHNKPSGSYTGNGGSTVRTINTGGIGRLLLVQSDKGTAFVTPKGAFTISGSNFEWLTNAQIIFDNNDYTISTGKDVVNANGITYKYYVI